MLFTAACFNFYPCHHPVALCLRYRGDRDQLKSRYWANQQNNQNGQTEKTNIKGKQPGENLKKPQWDLNNLQPFLKDFYVPHSDVANRSVVFIGYR
jgi:hypothetical protein